MYINRTLEEQILKAIQEEQKVVLVYGARQTGKTTLIKHVTKGLKDKIISFTGDDIYTQTLFGKNELEALKRVVGDNRILIIDEAQRIENIGLTLKLLIDNLPLTILASGSASFDLANKVNEPLTGRTKTFQLYPLAYQEIAARYQQTSPEVRMDSILRFGLYPSIHTLSSDQDKQDYLYEYINNYLSKDILTFAKIRKPKKVMDLLALLALQIGKEVSIAELAQNLALSQKAIQKYLDVLEKMFVIINLRGFSRNLRKEISKTSKYYFVDVGLRNALIRNFNPLNIRQDTGELFENWFILEKIKRASNQRHFANFYFWRTYDQKEIDLIEEANGKLVGFECKWSAKKGAAPPSDWLATYKEASFINVNSSNCFEYL